MNLRQYIASGVLELYVLGLLGAAERADVDKNRRRYPEIEKELKEIAAALESYARSHAMNPPPGLKDRVLDRLSAISHTNDPEKALLPLISTSSDVAEWRQTIAQFIPGQLSDGVFQHVLQQTPGLSQVLVISSDDFADESHEDLYESFLILEGTCRCTVGEHTFYMHAGDFTEIPLYTRHNVEIVSPRVMAIVQHVAV